MARPKKLSSFSPPFSQEPNRPAIERGKANKPQIAVWTLHLLQAAKSKPKRKL